MDAFCKGVDALYRLCQAHPTMRGKQVVDGSEPDATRGSFLAIGVAGGTDPTNNDGSAFQAGLAGRSRQTTDTATCVAYSSSGDKSMKPRRDEAVAFFNVARDIVEGDPTLGGVVKRAEITSWTYESGRDGQGAAATIEFEVTFTSV